MRKEQIEKITRQVGTADASQLINKLESLGVGEDIKLFSRSISIPKSVVQDVATLQRELSSLSKVGRSYQISYASDRIIIDTIKCTNVPLHTSPRDDMLSVSRAEFGKNTYFSGGIREQHVELPPIPRGSKVLDVGAGSGFLSKKIQDSLECDVYALEPSFASPMDYECCVQQLGQAKVEKLTLQNALASNPEKYFQAFDVVTVFKYNVLYTEKEAFIKSLTKVVKPGGTIFITSVEAKRFFLETGDEGFYLTEIIQHYFGRVIIQIRKSFFGEDGLMICTHPKQSLVEKPQKPPILSSVSTTTISALSESVHEECDGKKASLSDVCAFSAKKIMKT